MALLAEEVVQEWLARQGYFSIRGLRVGVDEIDLLAVGYHGGIWRCRHLEVQVSHRPISYLSRVPKAVQQATGRKATSARTRNEEELRQGIQEWIHRKFDHPEKELLRQRLAPGPWSRELVIHKLREPLEKQLLQAQGVQVHQLSDLIRDMQQPQGLVKAAAGEALLDLIGMVNDIPQAEEFIHVSDSKGGM